MKRPIFKDVKNDKQYLKNGYVKEQLLSPELVKETLAQILQLKPDDNYEPNRPGASKYHCTFLDTNEEYKRATNMLFKRIFNPIVDRLFHNYQVWNANLYVKPPGTGKFEIHQNWTHVAEECQTSFTMWCPLVDTSEENGTLSLVEGSHKILPDIATMDVPYYFKNFEDKLISDYLKPIACKAGDAVIFEDGVIHFSDVNKSSSPRYALQILVGPKEVNPVYFYFNPHEPELGFELFEINEEFFMKNSYLRYRDRPSGQRSLGHVPNKNQSLELNDFKKALKKGAKRREKIYE